jgi:hypothetical protein
MEEETTINSGHVHAREQNFSVVNKIEVLGERSQMCLTSKLKEATSISPASTSILKHCPYQFPNRTLNPSFCKLPFFVTPLPSVKFQ